jgi:hypothetical protein
MSAALLLLTIYLREVHRNNFSRLGPFGQLGLLPNKHVFLLTVSPCRLDQFLNTGDTDRKLESSRGSMACLYNFVAVRSLCPL